MTTLRILGVVFVCLFINAANVFAEPTCYGCHSKDLFVGKSIHGPVAKGDCRACHNPHVAKYKQLLSVSTKELCYGCHGDLKKNLDQRKNVHQPFREADCLACHDPHSSNSKGLVRQDKPGEACFGCHKDMDREFEVEHKPFASGNCQACHNPHFSDKIQLLNDDADELCVSCHGKKIEAAHKGLPVKIKRSACVTCHSPHGSDRKALQRNVLHEPYQDGCGDCHENGEIAGADNCIGCHEEIGEQLNGVGSHQTNRFGNACINCHSPHASDTKNMLKNIQAQVCRGCHADTWENYIDKKYKHPDSDLCSNCHAVHGSSNVAMLKGDGNTVCGLCHDTQGDFSHPVGDGVIDPRNGNIVSCVTCHYPHGTDYKKNLKHSGSMELCIQCHKNY